jgi:hypothetical protein
MKQKFWVFVSNLAYPFYVGAWLLSFIGYEIEMFCHTKYHKEPKP